VSRRKSRRAIREPIEITIDGLSHEGRGVGRIDGKAVFVHGALPGERVLARIQRSRATFDEADTVSVLEASPQRIEPRCPHFGVCGGCSLQHMSEEHQLAHKQSVMLELLQHQAGLQPQHLAEPIHGPQWGYRRKARLGVKHVAAKGGVIVGFRERAKPYVTNSEQCDVLDARVGQHLPALRALIQGTSVADKIPQIEVAIGDDCVALVIRHMESLSESDEIAFRQFAELAQVDIYSQSGGLDTVRPLNSEAAPLSYTIDGLNLRFEPVDFVQVNAAINADMIARAIDYLQLTTADAIADLFCGLGNFSLPLARRAGHLLGIEGDAGLIERAGANARANGIENCEFRSANLADPATITALDLGGANKLLLDPPRTGALELIEGLDLRAISRLVYVSCNPVTFARDAALLCDRHGFALLECGVLDMFPQTAHVESISLFAKP